MTQRQITIEDIDILFNEDKRGRQIFIIMTNGLLNFDYNDVLKDTTSRYAQIRKVLKNDSDYKEVLDTLLSNIWFQRRPDIDASTASNNPYIQKILANFYNTPRLLIDAPLLRIKDIQDFLTSINTHLDTIVDKSSFKNQLIDGTGKPNTIPALDKYIKDRLTSAWKKYKSQDDTKYNPVDIRQSLEYPRDVAGPSAPFTDSTFLEEKIILLEDKFHKINKKGEIAQFSEDKVKCKSYGFDGNDNCDAILYECLVNPSTDNLEQCIQNIVDYMANYNLSDDNLKNMNPEIVLALLHRFGFKAIKDNNEKKQIISVQSWVSKIFPKLKIKTTTPININIPVLLYLQKLVNYINSKPEILNGNNFTTNDFYDPVTHKDKFGKNVDHTTTNKSALEGLTRFYENNQFYRGNPNNFGNLLGDLYDMNELQRPNYLQSGGNHHSPYKLLKEEMANGNTGVKYLTTIYESLISSLTNVDISEVNTEMKKFLREIKKNENKIIKYLEFLDEVNKIYNLFKYAPTKVKFDETDITKLNVQLQKKMQEYKDKEAKVARFIRALAKKELHPFSENSVFDI